MICFLFSRTKGIINMKSITITIASLFFFSSTGFSQITKGNWMVGGNANVSLQKEKLLQSDITGWGIKVLPDIGFSLQIKLQEA